MAKQGSLRIISGVWGGRKLLAPPGQETRPLTDRIKQSLFDWLGQSMDGWRVVDACAGSGVFGIECASRGASEVHLCEPARHAVPTIRENLAAVGNPASVRLHSHGFQTVLPGLSGIDLVFCDPPFPWFRDERGYLSKLVEQSGACLAEGGLVLIRGERGQELPEHGLVERERREYGRSWVALLVRPSHPAD